MNIQEKLNHPLVAFTFEYARLKQDEYNKLPIIKNDEDGISRLPEFSLREPENANFFEEYAKTLYESLIENEDITFNLNNHFQKDGTKLKDVQKNTKEGDIFSKTDMIEELCEEHSFFFEQCLQNLEKPEESLRWLVGSIYEHNFKMAQYQECTFCGIRMHIHYDFFKKELIINHIQKRRLKKCEKNHL